MNVLVTGGAGYIGSHAAKALAAAGHEPISFDNLMRGNKELVKWGPLVIGSLSDKPLLTATMRRYSIEAIMHFAAYAYVGESMASPSLYFRNNTCNSLTLIEACCDVGISNFIFSSTCATYGDPIALPISESHPQVPVNPYGESKLMTEKALRWHGEIHGLRSVILRYFNAAGADADLDTGELHDPETHLIPLVLESTRPGGRPVKVFGSDYPTEDGTAVRDFIHVTDLADAHVQALEYLNSSTPSAVFNLGTGRGHSVKQVLEMARQVTGAEPSLEAHPRRVGDPAILFADNSRALSQLRWRPMHSDLRNIIETAWQWSQRIEQGLGKQPFRFAAMS